MSARKGKSSRSSKKDSGGKSRLRKFLLILAVLALGSAAAIGLTERTDLPAAYRNHDSVIMVYNKRDSLMDTVRAKFKTEKPLSGDLFKHTKEQINVRPAAKKPEQGYSRKDRDQMQDLIREEGETP